MFWIEEIVLFRVGFVFQIAGIASMMGMRLLGGEAKSMCEYLFFMSMFLVGVFIAIAVSRGSYDWPVMGITLSVMTVGAMVETKSAGESQSGQI